MHQELAAVFNIRPINLATLTLTPKPKMFLCVKLFFCNCFYINNFNYSKKVGHHKAMLQHSRDIKKNVISFIEDADFVFWSFFINKCVEVQDLGFSRALKKAEILSMLFRNFLTLESMLLLCPYLS